jgi:hypothetical protein
MAVLATATMPYVRAQGWTTIQTFTGTANLSTPNFSISSDYWRITYTVTSQSGQIALLDVYLYLSSAQYPNFFTYVTLNAAGTGTSYVHEGPGSFWMSVETTTDVVWTIVVQIPST